MYKTFIFSALTILAASGMGCATSAEHQRQALIHQEHSDDAAMRGHYTTAGDEQRKAQAAHSKAVQKAIDEEIPIPPQTRPGDLPPPALNPPSR